MPQTNPQTTDLREYIRIILVRRWVIIFALLSVLASTLFWLRRATPVYEAKAILMREVTPSPALSLLELSSPTTPSPTSIENQRLMITSRLVLDSVIEKLKSCGIQTDLKELRKDIIVTAHLLKGFSCIIPFMRCDFQPLPHLQNCQEADWKTLKR